MRVDGRSLHNLRVGSDVDVVSREQRECSFGGSLELCRLLPQVVVCLVDSTVLLCISCDTVDSEDDFRSCGGDERQLLRND